MKKIKITGMGKYSSDFNPEVWLILREIKKEYNLTPKKEEIEFKLRHEYSTIHTADSAVPSFDRQKKILAMLEELEVLKSYSFKASKEYKPGIAILELNRNKFEAFYKKYLIASKAQEELGMRPNIEIKEYDEQNAVVTLLVNNRIRTQSLGARETDHRVFNVLWKDSMKNQPTSLKDLMKEVNGEYDTDKKTEVRKAISSLRSKLGEIDEPFLLITTVRGRGYKLNQKNF